MILFSTKASKEKTDMGRDFYQELGLYYDEVVGDRKEAIRQIRTLLREYAPKAQTLLEVACGTGTVLKALEKKYSVSGVDYSEIMLSQAAQKLPAVPLYQGDMRGFSLGVHCDVALCVYDSINHVRSLAEWKRTFRSIRRHLESDGVFIFDMNTLSKLNRLAAEPPVVHEFGESTYILNVMKRSESRFDWHARLFHPANGGGYSLLDEVIPETSYPIGKVREALAPFFQVLAVRDFERERVSSRSERVYFVCRAR